MIKTLVEKNCLLIYRFPFLFIAALLALTIAASYFYTNLPIETSVESLIIEDDPDLLFYEKFKEQFGEDEFLVVGFQHPAIFSTKMLQLIETKTAQLEKIPEVKEVVSLTNAEDILGTEFDFIVQPFIEAIPVQQADLDNLKNRAKTNTLITGNLLSDNADAVLFLLRTQAHPGDETYDSRLISQVKQVLAQNKELDFHLAGWLSTDVSMSEYMQRDMLFFMPLTYLLIGFTLWFFLRNITTVVISLITVSITLVWTMALLYLIGGSMSPMTSILSPLIMALIVSDCVHIFTDFLKNTDAQDCPSLTLLNSVRQLGLPCFLTSLTTAVGFACLGLSNIPPIRHLGIAAAGGMIIEFILAMTIIPLAIYCLRKHRKLFRQRKKTSNRLAGFLSWWSVTVAKHAKMILALGIAVTALSVYGSSLVSIETNLIDYFKAGSEIKEDTVFFDKHLGGATTLEISIKSDKLDFFKDPENLQIIEDLDNFTKNFNYIKKSTSVNTFIKQMNQAFHNNKIEHFKIPEDKNLIAQYLLLYDGKEMAYLINEEFNWARVSYKINEHRSNEIKILIDSLNSYIEEKYADSELTFAITGKTSLVNKLVKSIVDSQVSSLSLAIIIIIACLIIFFKSIKLGLLSVIPNLFPIIINFGIMGFLKIPLNTATAIISAIAIGIAVDDTIHYLVHYQQQRAAGANKTVAALSAITAKGTAILSTSFILTGAFAILCLSNFVPTIQFGFLCSTIMLSAVLGDLALLPSAIISFSRSRSDKPVSPLQD